jgi:hypothetical protein
MATVKRTVETTIDTEPAATLGDSMREAAKIVDEYDYKPDGGPFLRFGFYDGLGWIATITMRREE